MRILLADSQANVRLGLRVFLGEQFDFKIIGEVENTIDLLALLQTGCPDLVLLSWDLPGLQLDQLMPQMQKICPKLYVVVLSGEASVGEAARLSGATDFFCKADSPEKLMSVIWRIQQEIMQARTDSPSPEIRYPSDIGIL